MSAVKTIKISKLFRRRWLVSHHIRHWVQGEASSKFVRTDAVKCSGEDKEEGDYTFNLYRVSDGKYEFLQGEEERRD